jgi:hypothetical protein
MVPPLVLDECLVSLFRYWNQEIRQGMRHNNELFALFHTFPAEERLKAYALGYEQSESGATICITVSKTSYRVWISLRSLSHANPANANSTETLLMSTLPSEARVA